MAKKRFTDIEIWDKEWYMELTPKHKCLMKYIFDKCDSSGCWKPNWRLASLHINDEVNYSDLAYLPKDQYEILDNGKIFIPDFIKFQYGKLSKECRPHLPIIATVEKNDLSERLSYLIEDSATSIKSIRRRLTDSAKKVIFEEDDYQCQYCGDRPGSENLYIDHIKPLISGGDNSNDNLTTACTSCNSKKHDHYVFDFMRKHNLSPLYNLSKKLNTLFNNCDTLKEEEEEIDKTKEKEILQEKKTVVLPLKKSFNTKPFPSDFNGLPEMKIGAVIELLKITKQIDISTAQVTGLWNVFKIQNLSGEKYYRNEDEVYSHFINWSKTQKIESAPNVVSADFANTKLKFK